MKVEKDYEEIIGLLNKNKKRAARPTDLIDIDLLEKARK